MTSIEKPIRVLISKAGLDGHDRGAKVIALGLRDEGMEVIYTGLRQTPETIARAAIQESVDVIGVSCLSGAHCYVLSEVMKMLNEKGLNDILVIAGGIIPEEDTKFLKERGVSEVFGPGSFIKDIANFIRKNVRN